MGHRKGKTPKSHTLPSSPTHSFSSSSSSSDFEFTISLSPRKSSSNLCPADELFYKGQLLPLHLSPRISMVRTLLLSSSSTSSSTTTASRHSSGSSTDSHSSFSTDGCDSSRPSSVAEDDDLKRLSHHKLFPNFQTSLNYPKPTKSTKYFSLSRFSSVFRKEPKTTTTRVDPDNISGSSVKRMRVTAKEVICKYLKKARPLYEKLSQKQGQQKMAPTAKTDDLALKENGGRNDKDVTSHSFSGNLRYPRKRSCVSSCPSSMRSSPSHSGILCRNGAVKASASYTDTSSMEELQSAIQGAIAHCKNSMIQNKASVSNEI